MPKSALLSLLLVFASGALVGVVGDRLTVSSATKAATARQQPKIDPEEARRRIVADQKQRFGLDDHQIAELNRIYDETRQEFDQLHKEGSAKSRAIWEKQKAEVRALMRPDQLPLYDKWQAERDAQRKRDHRPPPGADKK